MQEWEIAQSPRPGERLAFDWHSHPGGETPQSNRVLPAKKAPALTGAACKLSDAMQR